MSQYQVGNTSLDSLLDCSVFKFMQFQLVVANLNLLVVMERAQVDLQRMATKDSQMVKSKNLTPDLPCHVTFTQNYLLKKT